MDQSQRGGRDAWGAGDHLTVIVVVVLVIVIIIVKLIVILM